MSAKITLAFASTIALMVIAQRHLVVAFEVQRAMSTERGSNCG